MTPAETRAWRESFAAQTAAARERALAAAPTEISEHGRQTLRFLFSGSTQQQEPQERPSSR